MVTDSRTKILLFTIIGLLVYLYLYSHLNVLAAMSVKSIGNSFTEMRHWHQKLIKTFKLNYWFRSSQLSQEDTFNTELQPLLKLTQRKNISLPIITLFTSWKTRPEKYACYNNTLYNWNYLKPFVKPYLFTNNSQDAEDARKIGWKVLPVTKTGSKFNIPVLQRMFVDVMAGSDTPFYGYANGDNLFTQTLINTLIAVLESNLNHSIPIMIIGQRTNVMNMTRQDAGTLSNISAVAASRGSLFTPWGEDYFITNKIYPWKSIPDVVIGRVAYDNWLVLHSKKSKFITIDATRTLLDVHGTTRSGNMEGHRHPDPQYNANLLARLYKSIKYGAGITSCAEHYTQLSKNGNVSIQIRKLPGGCIP